jgi:hypothetical protein
MQMRGHAGNAARKNFAAFCDKFFKEIGIFVVDGLNGNVDSPARHGTIGAAKGGTAFGGFRTHHFVSRCNVCRLRNGLYFFFSSRFGVRGLFLFRVVIYREAGLPKALASVHSNVTISCAIVLFLHFRRRGFLFFSLAAFFLGQTEQ